MILSVTREEDIEKKHYVFVKCSMILRLIYRKKPKGKV